MHNKMVRVRILRPLELNGRIFATREQAWVGERLADELVASGVAEFVRPLNGVDLGPTAVKASLQTR